MRRIREAKPRMMLVRRDSRAELYMKRDVNFELILARPDRATSKRCLAYTHTLILSNLRLTVNILVAYNVLLKGAVKVRV